PAALAALDEIAKVEQPNAGVWFVRAICYDKLNQPKPALEAYQKFLDLDQDKNPDQVWQAQQRSKVLKRMLEGKKGRNEGPSGSPWSLVCAGCLPGGRASRFR